MTPTISDLPPWERTLLRQVRDAQANEGALYRQLCAGWDRAAERQSQPVTARRVQATKREAVARFTDIVYAFASAVLAAPHDYTAHAVNYATGLLNEAVDYVKAEQAATKASDNV
ncbi:hypothetical protein [Bradyrhizobium sp.]|uniref:hypothetical protein n=1 Tax=Bradyrhizobium sp. TaxID=376 RepID=UPI0025BFC346|nr:hypothetical protein [Bradyrhizobium sp.]